MAAPSRSHEDGCGRPSARSGETRVTSQQSASPRRDAPYMTRSSRRRSSGATPGAVVRQRRLPAAAAHSGRRRRDGRPAGPPRFGSLAHRNGPTRVAASEGGERLAYPTARVVCPRPWGWLATSRRDEGLPGSACRARELGDKLLRRRS